jgi:hypothetical protein
LEKAQKKEPVAFTQRVLLTRYEKRRAPWKPDQVRLFAIPGGLTDLPGADAQGTFDGRILQNARRVVRAVFEALRKKLVAALSHAANGQMKITVARRP